jgi:hypothetical protein
LLKVIKRLTGKFGEVKQCAWETTWLNEFMQHQVNKSILIIESEKGFEESFFYELKDTTRKEVFLNPDEKIIDFYIAESDRPVVVKKLLTRAPLSKRTEKKTDFYTLALEKILVDIVADERLFSYLQGAEMMHIYENAFTNYDIDLTKLFSYARRRKREQDIKKIFVNHLPHLVKNSIDD